MTKLEELKSACVAAYAAYDAACDAACDADDAYAAARDAYQTELTKENTND